MLLSPTYWCSDVHPHMATLTTLGFPPLDITWEDETCISFHSYGSWTWTLASHPPGPWFCIMSWPQSSFGFFPVRCYSKTKWTFFGQPNRIKVKTFQGPTEPCAILPLTNSLPSFLLPFALVLMLQPPRVPSSGPGLHATSPASLVLAPSGSAHSALPLLTALIASWHVTVVSLCPALWEWDLLETGNLWSGLLLLTMLNSQTYLLAE